MLSSSESDVASTLEAAIFIPAASWDGLPGFTSGRRDKAEDKKKSAKEI